MDLGTIAQQAKLKGLAIVGTGDVFHPTWFETIEKELQRVAGGTFEHPRYGTRFILTNEVEDRNRVHHLILFPSIDAVESVREDFAPRSEDIDIDGRATLDMSAPEIVDTVVERGCLIGPAHAFTPWTSMYKEFDSVHTCYEDSVKKVKFLELGLSADTPMADRISELRELTFLSCSDAHSPWPDKLGREFNRLELEEPTFKEVVKAIERREGRRISLNVGFDPRLGKYHRTACSRCFKQFEFDEAKRLGWKCDLDGGWVKKGVWDRVQELADQREPQHPPHRPPYLKIAPLAEVVALAISDPDPHSPEVGRIWRRLVERFGNEIFALVDAPLGELVETAGPRLGAVVKAFREGNLRVTAGGGGKYGCLELPEELGHVLPPAPQRKLTEFGL
jgi:uncharacterized protein (TIGR00375 family)